MELALQERIKITARQAGLLNKSSLTVLFRVLRGHRRRKKCFFSEEISFNRYFAWDDFEEQDENILFFQIILVQSSYISNRPVQNSQRGKEFNKFCSPNRSNDLCRFFCLYPSSMVRSFTSGGGRCERRPWRVAAPGSRSRLSAARRIAQPPSRRRPSPPGREFLLLVAWPGKKLQSWFRILKLSQPFHHIYISNFEQL